jgi:hypothetical protein
VTLLAGLALADSAGFVSPGSSAALESSDVPRALDCAEVPLSSRVGWEEPFEILVNNGCAVDVPWAVGLGLVTVGRRRA